MNDVEQVLGAELKVISFELTEHYFMPNSTRGRAVLRGSSAEIVLDDVNLQNFPVGRTVYMSITDSKP